MSWPPSFNVDLGDVLTIVTLLGMQRQSLRRVAAIEFKVGLMWKRFAQRFDLPQDIEHATDEGAH